MKSNLGCSAIRFARSKKIAWVLLLSILFEMVSPFHAVALTGGPSQPEVQSFEPVGTSDMVDAFSGDFNYNIPLLKVGDYPINLSYHSGITTDQEASWVGLGWNINPGVINRNMRGIPDDFAGDEIVKDYNIKPNRTYGVSAGANVEIIGLDNLKLGFSLGIQFNNYNGFTVNQGLNLSISAGGSGSPTVGLGINSSSDEGLSIAPSISFGAGIAEKDNNDISVGLSVGTSFNSRQGLKQLTISSSGGISNRDTKKSESLGSASASFDLGMPTYTPSIPMNLRNHSITASFDMGFEAYTVYGIGNIGGFYSQQHLISKTEKTRAYGYLNSHLAGGSSRVTLDFNREKDGTYSRSTPSLPLTNHTYDVFSVNGQGISGSYRPFRSDIGNIYDPFAYTTSTGGSVGGELGAGGLFHGGVDISVTLVNGTSGKWRTHNRAIGRLDFRGRTDNPLYEPYYFKEANEKSIDSDPEFIASVGGYNPVRFDLKKMGKTVYTEPTYIDHLGIHIPMPQNNYRAKREKRNQNISILKRSELPYYAVDNSQPISGLAKDHHIGEITTLSPDGSRYVYGLAAYNKIQEETSFSVGADLYVSQSPANDGNIKTGLVTYQTDNDNTTGNKKGIDNYFNNTKLPAYAHSFLLTAVLSPDYVDADNIPGPSDGDFGNYTKFVYVRVPENTNDYYKWRTPYEKASFNEGLKSDLHDDKGSYIYGEKELWFLKEIRTKEYVAIFDLSDRDDGLEVDDRNGGKGDVRLKKLDRIQLFSKRDLELNQSSAIPIQEVYFHYDYSLCPKVPNQLVTDAGKLTLKGVYFKYKESRKAIFSPYTFEYCSQFIDSNNYPYDISDYDRWGNYKKNCQDPSPSTFSCLYNNEYPYVIQDQVTADKYSSAWHLTKINLPSGGTIRVDYESDDYAYVQNRRAGQMFEIVDGQAGSVSAVDASIGDEYYENDILLFKLSGGVTDIEKYFEGIDMVYFRFLMKLKDGKYDFVSGYGHIDKASLGISGNYGYFKFKKVDINDNAGLDVPPYVKAAIQYGRIHNPKLVWDSDNSLAGDSPNFGIDLLKKMLTSNIAYNMIDAVQGPNKALYNKGVGKEFVRGKSWVRLNNPNKKKFGGGTRVKKIEINDNWNDMTSNNESEATYGQVYSYVMSDNTSSGVASYEPQLGGDENPWRYPEFYSVSKVLAPDDRFYMETPYGESFFPSPSVGYRRVIVKNLIPSGANVHRHGTGYTINEFFTTYDYPTITKMTEPKPVPAKSPAFSIGSLFNTISHDFMTASQGFAIELNDMNGKPKSTKVYQEGVEDPISSVEYFYKSEPYLADSKKLVNSATVIKPDGTTQTDKSFGVFFDMISDMRETYSITEGVSTNGNADGFMAAILPIVIPMIWPSLSKEETRFRSATTTKIIQRFGILDSTVATDLGSIVTTRNLAFDSETGEPLLTQTATNFNDEIYNLKVPAYYYYDRMGQAYKNIGFSVKANITNSVASVPNADKYFVPGDELAVSGTNEKAWVTEVTTGIVKLMNKEGSLINASGQQTLKVIRSGRRNTPNLSMMDITTLTNPLQTIKNNIYENVINSSAVEYYDEWKTYCDCFGEDGINVYPNTNNKYVRLMKGNFIPNKKYTYLTGRTQSKYNNNTNIRRDGTFDSYTPFYKLSGNQWVKDYSNWTYTSEITEYSPFDVELENKDALGRYAAATYGYAQTVPTSVAANARYRDIGFDGFEDYGFSPCADNHFKFDVPLTYIVNAESHTGKHSLKVPGGQTLKMNKQIGDCTDLGCDISLEMVPAIIPGHANGYLVNIIGGNAPFSYNYHIVVGTPYVNFNSTLNALVIASSGPFQIAVEVTDANGCIQAGQFTITNE